MRINSKSLSSVTYTFYCMTLTVVLVIYGMLLANAFLILPAQFVHLMPDTWIVNTLRAILI